MSALNRTNLKDKFNNASTGLFKTGQSRGIGSDDQRTQVEDVADSHFNLETDAYTGAKGLKNSVNTIAGLQAIVTTSLTVPFYTIFRDTSNGNILRVYELVAGTDAESSPDIIRPTDYAGTTNEKVWKLAVQFTYESFVVTAGGTDTYTATLAPAISAYATNQKVYLKFTNANTGAATINLNSLGAKSIKKSGGTALSAGDISAGQILCLVYDGTNFQIVGGGGSGGVSLTDPLVFKGVIDCSANPNYPSADAGDLYKVSVAGKIGGGSGPNVEAGDTLLCITDATASGTHAGVGANWVILQTNIDPSLYALLASPTFTGTPAAPTAAQGTNTTQLATTAFVMAEIDIVKNLNQIGGMGLM